MSSQASSLSKNKLMSRKQPFPIEEFESIYSRVPRLCVDLIIKNEQGVLLTLRQANGWVGQWHLPGGTIYLGEKVQDAIDRVAEEELGIKLKVEKLLNFMEYPSEKKERGYGQSISLAFLCTPLSSDIKIDNQVAKYGFFKTLPEKTIEEQAKFLTENFLI
jgi:ADP-ribose pyrophosphatase YjhB (NUDIX family)